MKSVLSKKPLPAAGACGDGLIKPGSLGVGNAAVGQSRLVGGASHFLLVVLLAAIGQGHLWFLRNPGPRSLACCSAPRRSEVNVVRSGCYRSFIGGASTPVTFRWIHILILVLADVVGAALDHHVASRGSILDSG